MHVIGQTAVLPLALWALIVRADFGVDHVAWGVMIAAGLAGVASFYQAGRTFSRVRRDVPGRVPGLGDAPRAEGPESPATARSLQD